MSVEKVIPLAAEKMVAKDIYCRIASWALEVAIYCLHQWAP
jgi:hypothetical protein